MTCLPYTVMKTSSFKHLPFFRIGNIFSSWQMLEYIKNNNMNKDRQIKVTIKHRGYRMNSKINEVRSKDNRLLKCMLYPTFESTFYQNVTIGKSILSEKIQIRRLYLYLKILVCKKKSLLSYDSNTMYRWTNRDMDVNFCSCWFQSFFDFV